MKNQAREKINSELKNVKGQKEAAVSKAVAETLIGFSNQDEEFAQAIVQSEKTLNDCLTAVMKNVRTSISDIEVYRRAVQFYFPGAGINFTMRINLSASVEDKPEPRKSKVLDINIDDLFG